MVREQKADSRPDMAGGSVAVETLDDVVRPEVLARAGCSVARMTGELDLRGKTVLRC